MARVEEFYELAGVVHDHNYCCPLCTIIKQQDNE